MENDSATNEGAIRDLIDRCVNAIRTKDIEAVMSAYAADVVAFDVIPPLQYVGADAYRKVWQELFDTFQSPIPYEIRDLTITAGDDIAFSHSLNRNNGTMKNGHKVDLWLRFTACYRKIKGEWRIAHLQVPLPVDLRTGKAAVDLQP
jgi:uncharacterized protein (TIGR02246 family)